MPQAPEHSERLATLESQMGDVRFILAKREDYQNSVLERLTEIKFKQDQFLDYQKTCDASREATAIRLRNAEDKISDVEHLLRSSLRVFRGQAFVVAMFATVAGWIIELYLKAK